MCGIVGYIGAREAQPILLSGLEKLEYRGYDSAGVAVLSDDCLRVRKCKGRIARLKALLDQEPLFGTVGIGHTRWATHGEPSDVNAHPQTDVKGDIAVVHNGIIENNAALRRHLSDQGCVFVSETDTEVVAHLLGALYEGDMLRALLQAASYLEGSYALAVLSAREPDAVFCMRSGSPLVVGVQNGECFLASDIPALLAHTRDVLVLADKEVAVLRRSGAQVFDPYGCERTPTPFHVNWSPEAAEKGGYAHFMQKEIFEQPGALRETLAAHVGSGGLSGFPDEAPARVTLVGCGTAYHACLLGAHYIETLAGIEARAEIASEFRYRAPFYAENETVIAVSQSGETADTLAAAKEAAKYARLVCLTNTAASSLERMSEFTMLTCAGPEIAVASTKAFVTQVETLLLLAAHWARKRGRDNGALLSDMAALPSLAEQALALEERAQRYSQRHIGIRQLLFIGRGADWTLAREAALKCKEVSYIPAEVYPAGELKHGAIALVVRGTPVVAVCTQPDLFPKTLLSLRETKARGAETLCVCPRALAEEAALAADEVWALPDAPDTLAPLLAILPMQLLAYHLALAHGRDVDKPRNLAKSVTVE